jgi:hypothetical protein
MTISNTRQVMMEQLQAAVARLGRDNARLASELARKPAAEHRMTEGSCSNVEEIELLHGQVQRLRLERRVMRVVTKVALAVASDTVTGVPTTPNSSLFCQHRTSHGYPDSCFLQIALCPL